MAGGWYHVTARGNRRETLFYDDQDRQGFLGLAAELPERFALEVHAFVLMDNHYHLLLRTSEANRRQAMQWLNVSDGTRSNWAHRLCGHVFQGRFKALLIEDLSLLFDKDGWMDHGIVWSGALSRAARLSRNNS